MKKIQVFIAAIMMVLISDARIMAREYGSVDIHGFVAQGFLQSTDNNFLANSEEGSFEFNEMGINFGTQLSSNLHMGLQLFARDLGDVGNDQIRVDWAYGDYSWREWLGLRAGLLKNYLGLHSATRDIDMLRTPILLPQAIYEEEVRDLFTSMKGFELYGNINIHSAGILKYQLSCVDLYLPLDSGTIQYVERTDSAIDEVTSIEFNGPAYLYKAEWITPLEGLRVAYSGMKLAYQIDLTTVTAVALTRDIDHMYMDFISLEYTLGDLLLSGEYMINRSKSATFLTGMPSMVLSRDTLNRDSWYAAASYRFTYWFEMGTYFGQGVTDNDASGPNNELNDICVTTRFDIEDGWIVKLEGHAMDGLKGTYPNADGSTDKDWFLFAAKVSYNF